MIFLTTLIKKILSSSHPKNPSQEAWPRASQRSGHFVWTMIHKIKRLKDAVLKNNKKALALCGQRGNFFCLKHDSLDLQISMIPS